jgi:hypothetical protein
VYQPPAPSKGFEVDDYTWGGQMDIADQPTSTSSVMNEDLGQYVMEQAIAKLLYHTGFEGKYFLDIPLT